MYRRVAYLVIRHYYRTLRNKAVDNDQLCLNSGLIRRGNL